MFYIYNISILISSSIWVQQERIKLYPLLGLGSTNTVLMVFTVMSSDCKVKKARFYENSYLH